MLPPLASILIGTCIILVLLSGIITWTIRISLRLNQLEIPKLHILIGTAFIQTLVEVVVTAILRAMKFGPITGIGIGIGSAILSGILVMKLVLQKSWKQTLWLWGIAAALQLVLIPIGLAVLLVLFTLLLYGIYPPVYR
jgi:hypothetical protein